MIDQFIIAICLQFNGDPSLIKYYYPCTQALTAASIQTHIKPEVEGVQHYYEKKAITPITDVTGERGWMIAGILHTTLIKKRIEFTMSAKPFVDNLRFSAGGDTENLVLTWTF